MKTLGTMALMIFASFSAQTAHASAIEKLIDVTSDAFPGDSYQIAVGTDDQGDIETINYSNSGKYTLDQLRGDGIVLLHNANPSRDVIILKLDNLFTGKDGGRVEIDYLMNGLRAHSYGVFNMELVRGGLTWLPYVLDRSGHRSDRPFGNMKFVANHFLGQLVGVSRVQTW